MADGAPRVRTADLATQLLPDGRRLLQVLGSNTSVVLEESLELLVRRTLSLRTVPEHARALTEELQLDRQQLPELEQELRYLLERGVLVREDQLRASLLRHRTADPTIPLSGIRILAANRPDLLDRALSSTRAALQRTGRSTPLAICDDARAGEHAARHRASASRYGAAYADRPRRAAWAESLAREASIDPQLAAWALLGDGQRLSNGAARNSILLDGIGRSIVSLDDDVQTVFGAPCTLDQRLELSSSAELTEIYLYPTRAAALAAAKLDDRDGLALHEQLLGRSAADCIAAARHTELEAASPAFLRRLSQYGGAVRATMCGIAGDSGMGSTAYYLSRRKEFRARLLANYPVLRNSREIVRSAKRTTITENSFFMTACAGFDGRGYLPPFFPIERNSDGLFAATLRALDPQALLGHLPAVIAHEPEQRTGSMERSLGTFGNTRLDELYLAVLEQAHLFSWPGDLDARTTALGQTFVELGSLPAADFYDFARRARSQRLIAGIARLEAVLEEHNHEPDAWAKDLYEAADRATTALETAKMPVPIDLLDTADPLGTAQLWLERYGRILISWPALRAAARTLCAREDCLFAAEQR